MFQPGDTIFDYEIQRRLESGGTGVSYVALDRQLKRRVTVTMLFGDLDLPGVRERFKHDARAAAVLDHPNIATIYSFGEYDSQAYVVTEYVEGETLAHVAQRDDASVPDRIRWMEELCSAVSYAQTRGLSHGDISPSNLMIDVSGRLKVLDFGVVQMGRIAGSFSTGLGTGSRFMAPERLQGAEADTRSDVYSIGAVCYELLTHHQVFSGDFTTMIYRVVHDNPVAPSQLDPRFDPELEAIVMTALRKAPDDRFANAEALRRSLHSVRGRQESWHDAPAGAPPVSPAAPAAPATPPESDERQREHIARHRGAHIARHLEEARRRLAEADLDGARRAAEQALELDASLPAARAILSEVERNVAREARRSREAKRARVFDDDVQFTCVRPQAMVPHEWHPLLVFAHLSEPRADEGEGAVDPVAEVRRQAEAVFHDRGHVQLTADSSRAIPREGELTFVPRADGVEFDPPSRSFRWTEPVHREEFLCRMGEVHDGRARGRITVYLGSVIVAELNLSLPLGPKAAGSRELVADSARPYRKIFASYSHLDRPIVEEFAAYAKAVGDRYEWDVLKLRSGEQWGPALRRLIAEADVFQLFWSWNALSSPHVRSEWEYALQLDRPSFVRPVYWDEPLPTRGGLPPSSLLALHFESIRPRSAPIANAPPERTPSVDSADDASVLQSRVARESTSSAPPRPDADGVSRVGAAHRGLPLTVTGLVLIAVLAILLAVFYWLL